MPPKKNWAAIRVINQRRAIRRQQARELQRRENIPNNNQEEVVQDNTTPDNSETEEPYSGEQQQLQELRQQLQERAERFNQPVGERPRGILDHIRDIGHTIDTVAGEGTSRGLIERGAKSLIGHVIKRASEYNQAEPADKAQRVDETVPDQDVDEDISSESFRSPETEDTSPSYSPIPSNSENMEDGNRMDTTEDEGAIDAAAGGFGGRSGGTGSVGSAGMGIRGQVERPTGNIQRPLALTHTYVKQYKLRLQTAAIDYTYINNNIGVVQASYRLPFHDLPVDYIGFYLTQQEMRQLAALTRVDIEHCQVNIYSDTAIIPFETQSSVAAVGNNNVGVGMCTLKNLTNKRWGEIPLGSDYIKKIFWGQHPALLPATGSSPSTVLTPNPPAWLTTRNFDRRYSYYYSPINNFPATTTPACPEVTDATYYVSYFPWRNFVKKRWNASITEGWCEHWEYKPKNKYMFGRNRINLITMGGRQNIQNPVSFPDNGWLMKQKGMQSLIPSVRPDQTCETTCAPTTTSKNMRDTVQTQHHGATLPSQCGQIVGNQIVPALNLDLPYYHDMRIESDQYWNELGESTYSSHVPNCTIGLEPLISNTETNTNIDAFVEITVNAQMTVKLWQNPDYLYLHGGAQVNDPFNAPHFKNPQMETTKQYNYATNANNEITMTQSTLKPLGAHGIGGIHTLDITGVDKQMVEYQNNTDTAISFNNTMADISLTRRSKRIEEQEQKKKEEEAKRNTIPRGQSLRKNLNI